MVKAKKMPPSKLCCDCLLVVDAENFQKKHTSPDGLGSRCLPCLRVRSRQHYEANKAAYLERNTRSRGHHPIKDRAHHAVRRALKSGALERRPCETCGDAADAHHDDYLKPLDVRWLCRSHHKEWHVANGPGLNHDAIPPRGGQVAANDAPLSANDAPPPANTQLTLEMPA